MALVKGNSLICIQDPTGTIKTTISEDLFERGGYKAKGWKVITTDWTKDRKVKSPVNAAAEMAIYKLNETKT